MSLMQNEQFKKIISEVDTNWPIKDRVRYVLQKLEICDETIIHIVTKGVRIKNLYQYTLWQESEFKENFNQKCKELFDAINNFIRNNDIEKQDSDNTVGILTFIETLQKNIMKDNEIKEVICLFQ